MTERKFALDCLDPGMYACWDEECECTCHTYTENHPLHGFLSTELGRELLHNSYTNARASTYDREYAEVRREYERQHKEDHAAHEE